MAGGHCFLLMFALAIPTEAGRSREDLELKVDETSTETCATNPDDTVREGLPPPPAHLGRLAAKGKGITDFVQAVKSNALLQSSSETNLTAEIKKKWPAAWAGKLEADSKRLGEGSFGTVWATKLKCEPDFAVAVKTLKGAKVTVEEFALEWGVMEAFSGINFIHIYGHLTSAKTHNHFLMMESATGGELTKVIEHARELRGKKNILGKMTTGSAADQEAHKKLVAGLTVDILTGILEMSKADAVHRDLKPANILLSHGCYADSATRCHAKIADLGLVCTVPGGKRIEHVNACEMVAGTPMYIPPEMWADSYSQDVQSSKLDTWSIGLILYEMIYGRAPGDIYNADEIDDYADAIPKMVISNDQEIKQETDEKLKDLIIGMVQHDYKSRWAPQTALNKAVVWAQSMGADVQNSASASKRLPDCWKQAGSAVADEEDDADDVTAATPKQKKGRMAMKNIKYKKKK